MAVQLIWSSSDTERLKGLILRQVAAGASVRDACQQFEFETKGRHSARSSYVRWLVLVEWTCRAEYKKALEQAASGASIVVLDEIETTGRAEAKSEEVVRVSNQMMHGEDEMANRLMNAVSQMIDDRRNLKGEVQEHKKLIELSERKIRETEEESKLISYKLQQKELEQERLERTLLDNQYKYDQLQDDYEQLMATRTSEYERLQQQIRELQDRHDSLSTDYARLRRETSSEAERLEIALRNAEIKNAQLVTESEEVRKENANLTQRITEFARQISNMLGQNVVEGPSVAPVPIRPVLAAANEDNDRAKA